MTEQEHIERVIPHSPEAEKCVLSSILQRPEICIDDAARLLTTEMFFSPGRQLIFQTILDMDRQQKPVDIAALTELLGNNGRLEDAGGPAELAELLTFAPSAAHMGYYIDIIRDKYILREVIRSNNETTISAYDEVPNVSDFLDQYEASALAIRESLETAQEAESAAEIVAQVVEDCNEAHNSEEAFGIPSGLSNLDTMIGGWKPEEVAIIAARPSEGKTALGIQAAEEAAERGYPTAVFSLEMSRKALITRLVAQKSQLTVHDIQSGMKGKSKLDYGRMNTASRKIAKLPLYIDDTPALSVLSLRSRVRRMIRKHGIKLVVIDYLQLMTSPTKRGKENRQQEVSDISSGIKALAKETKLPMVVLAQLNRGPEVQGRSREPRVSDLRESGAIEQDADLIALIARDQGCPNAEQLESEGYRVLNLIIGKQRNGATGHVKVKMHERSMKFYTRMI